MSKIDMVLKEVTNTNIKIVRIEEHLKNLNGQMVYNKQRGFKNSDDINEIKRKFAYYSGGLAVLIFTIGIAFKYL